MSIIKLKSSIEKKQRADTILVLCTTFYIESEIKRNLSETTTV